MKLVVFGLSISSSWGNGHATLWRGLCAALARRKHSVIFFERDVPYYSAHRDFWSWPSGQLVLYQDWSEVLSSAKQQLRDADVGMVTSYCPDGIAASDLVLESSALLRVFYDLDAPITLARLAEGSPVDYIGPRGLRDFDQVLSFTGGAVLGELKAQLGAHRVAPLYGCVDPSVHRPVPPEDRFRADLSYLGTYSRDRDAGLRRLFAEAAKRLPSRRFMLGGSLYDSNFPWSHNIHFRSHIPAADHPAFYCSSLLTLNVTRKPMADMGYCPSGRLFEAAACGAPLLSDWWEGLHRFFEPGSEILVAHDTDDVAAALDRSPEELRAISRAARDRALAEHTADVRAVELERILESSQQPVAESAMETY